MKTNIGIKSGDCQKIVDILSKVLADEFVLYTKTRKAHYNVEGPDFHSMHLFFESQYEELEESVDDVAERIRQLGHYAPSSLKEYLALTQLSENRDNKSNDSQSWIKDLVKDHEAIIIYLRENIDPIDDLHDQGTADFLTGLMQKHEEAAWMLRAHVK
ncbi:Dps family protein [Myroides indicus]|uniref:Starvation-inducible DNA-binding protein n=1 Tax=Myroides indicus TaxID=1323422 RepID=A0A4R7F681_9FLAO|nr:DNA starvation/stationary phase protection protein [Myroides indicus]TDS65308.1 starvation-inducible DNA-binding protein [Myroides indicus]